MRTKQMLALFLVIVLCVPSGVCAQELTPAEAYIEYIDLLNLYLTADPSNPVDINIIGAGFQNLSNYRCSMEFWLYTKVLSSLESESYNEAFRFFNVLKIYAEDGSVFSSLFTDETFTNTYPAIRPVEEMEHYIHGRKEEGIGNQTAASEHFEKCLKFFDARSRYQLGRPDLDLLYDQTLQQMKDGDYATAMENAQLLMGYDYEGAEDLYFVAEMQLAASNEEFVYESGSTDSVPTFEVQASGGKGRVSLSWDKVEGATEYRVYHCYLRNGEKNFTLLKTTQANSFVHLEMTTGINNYYYVEAICGDAENETILAKSAESKVYVFHRATPTPAPAWGSWSSWSTKVYSETSSRQVQKKTQYRSRVITKSLVYGEWSAWSSWSTTKVIANALMEVEKNGTRYRYRTRELIEKTTYGDWTSWGDTAVSASEDRQVETRVVYRYRDFK